MVTSLSVCDASIQAARCSVAGRPNRLVFSPLTTYIAIPVAETLPL